VAVALGTSLLGGIVLAANAFRHRLDVTRLGAFLGSQVRPFHVAIAVIALACGAIAAGEIVVLGYLEREQEFGMLRAVGWPRSRVVAVLSAQGLAMGAAGGLFGAAAVVAGGLIAGEPGAAVAQGAVVAVGAAGLATGLAVAGPLVLAYRASPARALRGE
jgi:ABC-type antimicrobial peptide transport system permease subunit